MSALSFNKILEILKEFSRRRKTKLEVILVGGLALHYYGMHGRMTIDLDAEVKGEIEPLLKFLKRKKIPADIGEAFDRWSAVGMPAGYRKRALPFYRGGRLTIKVLHPLDFVIAKLRRFTEEDYTDALFVARKYGLKGKAIENAGKKVLKSSPKDTALFAFRKNLEYFAKKLD